MAHHPYERKTIWWYKKIVVYIIQMILMNEHHLYNMYHPNMTMYDFRFEVIKLLLPPLIHAEVETPAQREKGKTLTNWEKCKSMKQMLAELKEKSVNSVQKMENQI